MTIFMKLNIKKTIPFDFVLDLLINVHPTVKPMFGCHAIYVGEKICMIVRQKLDFPKDNGVWLATTAENHKSLKELFPSMRDITVFGPGATGWQVLPMDALDFEASVTEACELIVAGDSRIGKTPKSRKASSTRKSEVKSPKSK